MIVDGGHVAVLTGGDVSPALFRPFDAPPYAVVPGLKRPPPERAGRSQRKIQAGGHNPRGCREGRCAPASAQPRKPDRRCTDRARPALKTSRSGKAASNPARPRLGKREARRKKRISEKGCSWMDCTKRIKTNTP